MKYYFKNQSRGKGKAFRLKNAFKHNEIVISVCKRNEYLGEKRVWKCPLLWPLPFILNKMREKQILPYFTLTQKNVRYPEKAKNLLWHKKKLDSICFILGNKINKNCLIRVAFENGIRFVNSPPLEKWFNALSQKAMGSVSLCVVLRGEPAVLEDSSV